MKIGGKEGHRALIRLALKKLIDEYSDRLEKFVVVFEDKQFGISFRIEMGDVWQHAHGSFVLIPDIVATIEVKEDIFMKDRKWKSILDSTTIIFEAETDPKKIFKNTLKLEGYSMVKRDHYGRSRYAFVLVCWEDAKLPDNLEPFDEIWSFPKQLVFKKG